MFKILKQVLFRVRIKSQFLIQTTKTLLWLPAIYLNDLTPSCFLTIGLIFSALWPFPSTHRPSSFPSQTLALSVPSAWLTFSPISPWLGLVYHARFSCLNLFPLTSPCLHFLQKINWLLNSDLLASHVLFHWNIRSMRWYKKLVLVLWEAGFPEPAHKLVGTISEAATLTLIHLGPVHLSITPAPLLCSLYSEETEPRECSDLSHINQNPGSSDQKHCP